MKIDMSQNLALHEKPVYLEPEKPATLGDACRYIVNLPPEKRLSLDALLLRGRLAERIANSGVLDITPEEAALIRTAIPDAISHPEVAVLIYDMLSGDS